MLKLYLLLFYEYCKIGVFALGGGYAALPFLYFLQTKYDWFTIEELTNMIAVSNITPGPIGINMATYTGYTTAGIIGSIVATSALVSVPFFMTLVITKLFTRFQENKYVCDIFDGLRPAACALLSSIGLKLLYETVFINKLEWSSPIQIDMDSLILFLVMFIPFMFTKKNPLLAIIVGAIGGIIIKSI